MRQIKYIAIHCTATQPNATVDSIKRYWQENLGWKDPGYHFIIDPVGKITNLQPVEKVSNGVQGFNSCTVNISYIGGIDPAGNPKDTRTSFQKTALIDQIRKMKRLYPNALVQGHRDFPGVKKACPSFDAKNEYLNL